MFIKYYETEKKGAYMHVVQLCSTISVFAVTSTVQLVPYNGAVVFFASGIIVRTASESSEFIMAFKFLQHHKEVEAQAVISEMLKENIVVTE